MTQFQQAAHLYYNDTGVFPVTDTNSTWFEKLTENNYLPNGVFSVSSQTGTPTDYRGIPFIYEFVADTERPDSTILVPNLRWTGNDGTDNGGKGDDIDLRYGVNFSYYYKSGWPLALGLGITFLVIFVFGYPILWWKVNSNLIRASAALSWCTYGVFSSGLIASDKLRPSLFPYYGISHDRFWLIIGGICFVLTNYICWYIVKKSGTVVEDLNECPDCHYSLQGIESERCPECGSLIPWRNMDTEKSN